MKALHRTKMSGNDHPIRQHNMPEHKNLQKHNCEKL